MIVRQPSGVVRQRKIVSFTLRWINAAKILCFGYVSYPGILIGSFDYERTQFCDSDQGV
jgi:hypothetical protein